jgi:hypothetical protein
VKSEAQNNLHSKTTSSLDAAGTNEKLINHTVPSNTTQNYMGEIMSLFRWRVHMLGSRNINNGPMNMCSGPLVCHTEQILLRWVTAEVGIGLVSSLRQLFPLSHFNDHLQIQRNYSTKKFSHGQH